MADLTVDRFAWHVRTGYQALERLPAIRDHLEAIGQRIADAAGGGPDFEVKSATYPGGAHVIVVTATTNGRRLEATDRALSRALEAGRG